MRIAFDVKGTIDGPKQKFVLGLLKFLQDLGHECVVWSSVYGYAVDAVKKHDLDCAAQSKTGRYDCSDASQYFDLAIDDDTGSSYLAAKRFIWVHNIPAAMGGVLKLAQEIDSNIENVGTKGDFE